MNVLKRLFLIAAVFALLCSGVYWLHVRFALDTGTAIALVGLAAVAVAVIDKVADLKRSVCRVSNAYLTLGEHDGWITFHFEAHVLISGDGDDTLQRIEYSFYHREHGSFPVSLIFGGRKLNEHRGQILPLPLTKGVTYFVETKESFRSDSPRGKRLDAERPKYEDYVFRCKFVCERAQPVTVRVSPYSYTLQKRVASWLSERRLGIRWMRAEPS